MKAIIVTGGTRNDKFIYEFIMHTDYDLLIAVDRGLTFFDNKNLCPDCIVGDFDSIKAKTLAKFRQQKDLYVQEHQPEKDETDTQLAVSYALEKSCDTLYILGATGSRLDHVLGNIELLGYARQKGAACYIIDPNNFIRLVDKKFTIEKVNQYGQYVSFIPYTSEVRGITLKGFKYPLKNYTMRRFYKEDADMVSGVSNEIIENEAVIELEKGILLMIESKEEEE